MNTLKTLGAALAATLIALPALAQTSSTARIDQRQENQQKRIDAGVQSGALNGREAARLEKGQMNVQRLEDKAVADGKVTARERARIEHAQDKQSRHIARQKHDAQRAR